MHVYGLVYKWSPAAGLNNAVIANPFAAPDITTNYIVTASNRGEDVRPQIPCR